MYKSILRPLLFIFPPETAHHIAFTLLPYLLKTPFCKKIIRLHYEINNEKLKRELLGLTFKNPVGLGAGFDKNALLVDELSEFGFGFLEIGTVTPLPQSGNPKPRLFRLIRDKALINRMGFNNDGAVVIAERLRKRKSNIIIGANIGKNKTTPNENAKTDYGKCFSTLFDLVDYFVVNVSSPNTPGLRELQEKNKLTEILSHIQELNQAKIKSKPILLKIAPDLSNAQLDDLINVAKQTAINGIVATNTTILRSGLKEPLKNIEEIGEGGLSGKPVKKRSTEVIKYLSLNKKNNFIVIGVGGIFSPEDAVEKISAGANLVQLYTGFIYEGPDLIKRICKKLKAVNGYGTDLRHH